MCTSRDKIAASGTEFGILIECEFVAVVSWKVGWLCFFYTKFVLVRSDDWWVSFTHPWAVLTCLGRPDEWLVWTLDYCLGTLWHSQVMMTSSNGNIFSVTLFAGNSLVTSEFTSLRPVTQSFDVFFDLCLTRSNWVNSQHAGDLRCNCAHCYVTVMSHSNWSEDWAPHMKWVAATWLTMRPRQYGCHFPEDILKLIFLNEILNFFIKTSLKFVPKGQINNIPSLV